MKIKPGKAKYKNMFTVAREKRIDHTAINLRKEMEDRLRQSIDEIAGMDMRRPLRRPRIQLSDSLQQSLFQLEDTLVVSPTEPLGTDSIPFGIDTLLIKSDTLSLKTDTLSIETDTIVIKD